MKLLCNRASSCNMRMMVRPTDMKEVILKNYEERRKKIAMARLQVNIQAHICIVYNVQCDFVL